MFFSKNANCMDSAEPSAFTAASVRAPNRLNATAGTSRMREADEVMLQVSQRGNWQSGHRAEVSPGGVQANSEAPQGNPDVRQRDPDVLQRNPDVPRGNP